MTQPTNRVFPAVSDIGLLSVSPVPLGFRHHANRVADYPVSSTAAGTGPWGTALKFPTFLTPNSERRSSGTGGTALAVLRRVCSDGGGGVPTAAGVFRRVPTAAGAFRRRRGAFRRRRRSSGGSFPTAAVAPWKRRVRSDGGATAASSNRRVCSDGGAAPAAGAFRWRSSVGGGSAAAVGTFRRRWRQILRSGGCDPTAA
jgi:hypothetical protein